MVEAAVNSNCIRPPPAGDTSPKSDKMGGPHPNELHTKRKKESIKPFAAACGVVNVADIITWGKLSSQNQLSQMSPVVEIATRRQALHQVPHWLTNKVSTGPQNW